MNDKEKGQMAKLEIVQEDSFNEVDRAIIGGNSVRIDIPLTSVWDLRRVPELLRGYATYMEFKLQQPNIEDRTKLSEIAHEGRATRIRIRQIAGASKFNKNGTVKRSDDSG